MAFIVRVFFTRNGEVNEKRKKKKGDTVMLIEVTMHLQF